MVNINPNEYSESANHHTHYLKFKKEYEFVPKYWEASGTDRPHLPWDWFDIIKTQTKNNSVVVFSDKGKPPACFNLLYNLTECSAAY